MSLINGLPDGQEITVMCNYVTNRDSSSLYCDDPEVFRRAYKTGEPVMIHATGRQRLCRVLEFNDLGNDAYSVTIKLLS